MTYVAYRQVILVSLIGIMRRAATAGKRLAQDPPCSNVQQLAWGESFAMAAKVVLDKWQARGLNPTVLAAIRTEVFDIGAPSAGGR